MNPINELRELAEDLYVGGYNRYASAMSKAADELGSLERYRTAYNEWVAKTEWVQADTTLPAKYLGMHRADVLKDMVSELLDRLEAAESDVAHQNAFAGSAFREAVRWEEKCNALRAEIIHLKEVEFPRKAQAVADGWRGKLEAAEKERDDVAQQLVQSEIGKREISEAHNTVTRRLSVLADENAALRTQIEAIHSLLDGDESKIIRNAKDGYPEGREPKELTLTERVTALCKYASDWERWFSEAESKITEVERQEPVEWQSRTRPVWNNGMWTQWSKCSEGYAKDIMKAPLVDDWMYEARPLYALPGAKGEVK